MIFRVWSSATQRRRGGNPDLLLTTNQSITINTDCRRVLAHAKASSVAVALSVLMLKAWLVSDKM
jgi:hypothetical protein